MLREPAFWLLAPLVIIAAVTGLIVWAVRRK